MENLLCDRGFFIQTLSFSKVESIRVEIAERVHEKKEQLSHQKCALLLNDLLNSAKIKIPLHEYIKERYHVSLDFLPPGEILSEDEIYSYIFNIFSEVSQKIAQNKEAFNFDILEDFDLSCHAYFYPFENGLAIIVDTKQKEYIEIFHDNLEISDYSFDVNMECPPNGVSYQEWAERAKVWLNVINRCGGDESWIPSKGGFGVDLSSNGLTIPDFDKLNENLASLKDNEFDSLLESMIQKGG